MIVNSIGKLGGRWKKREAKKKVVVGSDHLIDEDGLLVNADNTLINLCENGLMLGTDLLDLILPHVVGTLDLLDLLGTELLLADFLA